MSMDYALVGNANVAALINARGEYVWGCLPRVDGDPVFCSLLREQEGAGVPGSFSIEIDSLERCEQHYIDNTPVLVTRQYDSHGGAIEIVDFAPRFRQFGRLFCPASFVRRVSPLKGSPRVRVRLNPSFDNGAVAPVITFGSNHVRYAGGTQAMRLTTDASITAVVEEIAFVLHGTLSFVVGPDETFQGAVGETGRRFLEETTEYWREWVQNLSIPFEWQEAVIRAAITLKLNAYDDTGAIVAAVTSSLPESPEGGRNWDYRYCWLRDAYFVVNALNRLNATRTMERYMRFIVNVVANAEDAQLQPVYRVNGQGRIEEHIAPGLAGHRGMGPVRIGNQAWEQVQNDVYGSAILAATHIFFDRRLPRTGEAALLEQLEALGAHAARLWAEPDAGLWELRGARRTHTFSAVMCWVGCDRLAKICSHLGQEPRAAAWRERADAIHEGICAQAWSDKRGSFVSTFQGEELDASLLLLNELGFLRADDPRFAGTVAAVEADLLHGGFVFRYKEADDFGVPSHAFIVCTFWYIDALAALGRRAEARAIFETMLACRNRHGLLAEHIEGATRELWGNFPQTYSMVGLINSATRLSIAWDQAF